MRDTHANKSAHPDPSANLIAIPPLEFIELPDKTIEEKRLKLALDLRTY